MALIGIPGIIFTYFQLDHASKARLANTYLAISKDWDSLSDLRASVLATVSGDHVRSAEADRNGILLDLLDAVRPLQPGLDPSSKDNSLLLDHLERSLDTILSYFEDLGLLCRKGYVSHGDVFDIMGSSIVEFIELMLPYIERQRMGDGPDQATYANTLWLYEHAREALKSQFKIDGYGTPKLFFR